MKGGQTDDAHGSGAEGSSPTNRQIAVDSTLETEPQFRNSKMRANMHECQTANDPNSLQYSSIYMFLRREIACRTSPVKIAMHVATFISKDKPFPDYQNIR